MPDDANATLIKALEEVLDLERTALVNGELGVLDQVFPEKEKLVDAINEMHVRDSSELIGVHRKLERNQALLQSASEGIRAVAARMTELRRVRQEFSMYDSAGKRSGFAVRSHSKLEKRA